MSMVMASNSAILIRDAIAAGLDNIEKPEWRRHQLSAANVGIYRWLNEKKPDLVTWDQLAPGHVFEYRKWLMTERSPTIGPETTNHYLNPLRLAARYVALYFPKQWTQLFIRGIKPKVPVAPKRYLMEDQVAECIKTAHEQNDPAVVAAFYFGSMAGLRLEEIINLKAEDIQADGISVTKAKTDYSIRLIPAVSAVDGFAKSWARCNSRFPLKTYSALSHRIRKVLDATADRTKDRTYMMVDPHQACRTTFVNLALRSGSEAAYLDGYIGHAPTDVLGINYADLVPQINDMPRLRATKIEQMQNRVVTPINKTLEAVGIR